MRQVIKAIDIQEFFGKKESMSFKMIRKIKLDLNKKNHQPITIDEFCTYYGITRQQIIPIIEYNEQQKATTKQTTTENVSNKGLEKQSYAFSKRNW